MKKRRYSVAVNVATDHVEIFQAGKVPFRYTVFGGAKRRVVKANGSIIGSEPLYLTWREAQVELIKAQEYLDSLPEYFNTTKP